MKRDSIILICAGIAAGIINAIIGTGGGMLLICALEAVRSLDDKDLFPASVCIMFPISIISLLALGSASPIPWQSAAVYAAGGVAGGLAANHWGKKIPALWLHRILGIFMLWGGGKYLWQVL